MSDEPRIKRELSDDEATRHLSDEEAEDNGRYSCAGVDRKPVILPGVMGLIELSSDEDVVETPSRRRISRSFYMRLVVKEVATQTDVTATADAEIITDNVTKVEIGVNTDDPAKAVEVGVNTGVEASENAGETSMEVDEDDDEVVTAATSATRDMYYQCKVCSCYYLNFNLLQKHSQTQHNRAVSDHNKVAYNNKCNFCSGNYVFNTYNKHIKNKHSDKFSAKGNNAKRSKDEPYICTVCKVVFLTYNEGKRHRKVHRNVDQKFILKRLKTGETPKSLKAERKKTTPLHRAPIPKSTLFQCPKCELNFFNYRSGLRHKIACERGENTKGIEVNCSKCDRKFLSVHVRKHNEQHEKTNKNEFKICTVEDGIEHRILYRCNKCKICMEERSCNVHFQNGCDKSTGVPCMICHVKIDRDLMSKHKNAHGCMGMTKEQVILVDICDF